MYVIKHQNCSLFLAIKNDGNKITEMWFDGLSCAYKFDEFNKAHRLCNDNFFIAEVITLHEAQLGKNQI